MTHFFSTCQANKKKNFLSGHLLRYSISLSLSVQTISEKKLCQICHQNQGLVQAVNLSEPGHQVSENCSFLQKITYSELEVEFLLRNLSRHWNSRHPQTVFIFFGSLASLFTSFSFFWWMATSLKHPETVGTKHIWKHPRLKNKREQKKHIGSAINTQTPELVLRLPWYLATPSPPPPCHRTKSKPPLALARRFRRPARNSTSATSLWIW